MSEQYVIAFKLREESYGGSAEEAMYMLSDQIIPSLEMLEEWERDHKVMGGFFEGQRSGTLVLEAEDNMELDRMLASLPMMGVYDVDIAPVQRIGSALDRDRRIVRETRVAAGL
ncbi:MAG: hypothetical protein SA339_11265 [Methanomassiliicoccus sp.]|nr:hypothetical protein [Methanomassiliicoccus sp.]